MGHQLKGSRISRLVMVWAMMMFCVAGMAAKKRSRASSSHEPKATPVSRVPAEAEKYKPWGAQRAYHVTDVQVSPPAPNPLVRASSFVTTPEKFKSVFQGATLFTLSSGGRFVPSSSEKARWLDYIEVRPNGTGFGVNSDPQSEAHLYLSGARLIVPRDPESTAPAMLETDSEINYTGAGKEKRQAAHLVITADLLENLKKSSQTATPEAKKEKSKSEPEAGDKEKPSGKEKSSEHKTRAKKSR